MNRYDDLMAMFDGMSEQEREEFVERYTIERWGVTRDKLMWLSAEDIQALAAVRGISVAGTVGGLMLEYEGDDKDHRN